MNADKPVFIQIMDRIKDDILAGTYQEGDLIISSNQIATLLSVNPITSKKAYGLLADQGIVSKKVGLGMAVTAEAKSIILAERQESFHEKELPEFIQSAKRIGIDKQALISLIEEAEFDD